MEAFNLYWYFAHERQRIFDRRVHGDKPPWTTDPILQTYKFCNTFRASDRVSQYLIKHVAYGDSESSPEDVLFRVVAFRTFSKTDTWDALEREIGHAPRVEDLRVGAFGRALERVRSTNRTIYTNAFILCASDAYGFRQKHQNHVALFRHMFVQERLGARVQEARTLRDVFLALREYPLMGDFMSYQTAIDLNYTSFIDFSENEFTQPGPGALRGLKKVFKTLGDYAPSDVIKWMVERQDHEMNARGYAFRGLWGRPLHAIDCQGLFCETDKYCREAMPELTSARKRIKAKFVASQHPLPLFFPPKWGVAPHRSGSVSFPDHRTSGSTRLEST